MKQYVSKSVVSLISNSLQYTELHKSECNSCFNRLKQFLKSKVGNVMKGIATISKWTSLYFQKYYLPIRWACW